MDKDAVVRRIDELLALNFGQSDAHVLSNAAATTLTLLRLVHGPDSPQERQLSQVATAAFQSNAKVGAMAFKVALSPIVRGFLESMKADVEAGLVGSIENRALGAVLGDIIGLAKDALAEVSDGSKNVAAVLAAAAYEDTMRRMGTAFAGVVDRPDLSSVLTSLKTANVLQGASVSTAQGYLKFRNDALHADWAKIDRAVVASCIAFVEGLLMKHFS